MQALTLTTLIVRDYDEAIAFYVGLLGFDLREDRTLSPAKRWVVVTPPGSDGGLLLAKAAHDAQARVIGNQSGGRVFLFFETDDFYRDYRDWISRGVRFVEEPRRESYGIVAIFEDLYGNRCDLIERAPYLQ